MKEPKTPPPSPIASMMQIGEASCRVARSLRAAAEEWRALGAAYARSPMPDAVIRAALGAAEAEARVLETQAERSEVAARTIREFAP